MQDRDSNHKSVNGGVAAEKIAKGVQGPKFLHGSGTKISKGGRMAKHKGGKKVGKKKGGKKRRK